MGQPLPVRLQQIEDGIRAAFFRRVAFSPHAQSIGGVVVREPSCRHLLIAREGILIALRLAAARDLPGRRTSGNSQTRTSDHQPARAGAHLVQYPAADIDDHGLAGNGPR